MGESPATRRSLLVRLRDPGDALAWGEFVDVYGPLVYAWGCRQGLQDADAADLVQDVLRSVARAFKGFEYDARAGSFRGWLFTIARNKLRDFWERQRRHRPGTGDTNVQQLLEAQPAAEE